MKLPDDPKFSDELIEQAILTLIRRPDQYSADIIRQLKAERDIHARMYEELKNALASPSWGLRDNHQQLVELAKRMHDHEGKVGTISGRNNS